jgi:flagellar basal body P-ring formation protein FlgA
MKRLIYLFTLLFLFGFAPSGLAASKEDVKPDENLSIGPVSLRENITVSGSYIRLSDFFNNAPADKADTAVAYSPKPGRKASFDARWLFRVARAYGLNWRPLSADLNALVTRESIIIQTSEIKDALLDALVEYDLPENPLIELSNRDMNIHVPTETNPEIHVENMSFNARSMRFAALVSVGEKNSGSNQRVRVSGQVVEMIKIPTLNHRISKGDVIKENDISWIKQRADRTQRDIIVQAEDIIGMTPKRHLRPETPIRTSDIQRPVLVSKGSLVTIVLKQAGLSLTSQGRSLDDGADGETIRINNTHSNRTIEAIVIGENIVTVQLNGNTTPQVAYNR